MKCNSSTPSMTQVIQNYARVQNVADRPWGIG